MRAIFLIGIFMISCTGSKPLPKMEEVSEWKDLFNGRDLSGWTAKIHHYEAGDNYANTFRAEDGMIKVRYDDYEGEFNDRFGHLYTDQSYSNFHLILEYRFVGDIHPGTPAYALKNSGVMFHSQDPKTMLKEQNWPISVEMQFLAGITPGEERPTGNMCSPGTEVYYKDEMDPRHCIPSSSDTYFGDQWVKAELIVHGDSLVQHYINGEKVLEYTKPQIGGGVVAGYDPALKIDGQLLSKGHIALQAEGQPIDFRNIMIREL
ncbi:3-keto-disaccharide hydrolase [Portibacter marinus]|uniref:3-keto-disaccharide hydrolase n=1 Tax=Portibacter marinus TaxID=2898660 RepID=UPI001F2BF547|nr:DUF1080 domain-containing protein [Portibacter marinus]